jgi:nitroreductase
MNSVVETLMNRRTHRSFTGEPIREQDKKILQEATLRSPTAGNMMLYSVIEVTDQYKRDQLALLCDNQPMIAKAPLVWLFLADMRKWVNYYHESGTVETGEKQQIAWRKPGAGDLLLATNDALIAAQTAVIAAESLGIGSCYIGDILEQHEQIVQLFDLPQYTAVATLLIFGYPKNPQPLAHPAQRCPVSAIFMENSYQEPHLEALQQAYEKQEQHLRQQNLLPFSNTGTIADYYYFRKHTSDFMQEMNRSAQAIIDRWMQ